MKEKLQCLMKLFEDVRDVDKFTKKTKAFAAVLVKSGTDYYRLSSSLPGVGCESTVGTRLDTSSSAYLALLQGRDSIGKANLFGKLYYVYYAPYFTDKANCVVVALFVGIPVCHDHSHARGKTRLDSTSDSDSSSGSDTDN